MISCKNLQKNYNQLAVLKGIDLEIQAKEIVCITGESGAGKSTLLHLLGTLDAPTSGDIFFEQKNISSLKGNQLADFRNKNIEEQKKLKEAAKTAAIGGDYAGATSLVNKAMVPETMTNMAMMGPEAGMIAGLEAVKERDRQQQQLNNIYRLQQLSPGNIGPSNPFRGMESGIDRLPQFAPHATSGDRYNQRLADEAVLRGQLTTPPVKKASGGLVTGPGTGKSDSIPTRLSNGEFVINADMVKKLGLPFLNKLNADTLTDMSIKALGSRVLGKLPGVTSMVTKIAKPIPALGSAIGGALDGYDEYKNSNSRNKQIS